MKQKKFIIFIAIVLIFTIKFLSTICINSSFISKYNNADYDEKLVKKLLVLNIQESYIAHYNYGNTLYKLNRYSEAKTEYEKALKKVSKKRECDVRVNLALTEIQLVDTDKTSEELLKDINSIQEILLGNSCATKDHQGKDKKSQDLYDYLEEIKNAPSDAEGDGGDADEGDNEEQSDEDEEVIQNESDRIDQIRQRRRDASSARNPSRKIEYDRDYDGIVW